MVIYSNVSAIIKGKAESGKQTAYSVLTLGWSMVFQNKYILDITGENIGGAIFRVEKNTSFQKIFVKFAFIVGIQVERLLFFHKDKQIFAHQVVHELGDAGSFFILVRKKDKREPPEKIKKYVCLRI